MSTHGDRYLTTHEFEGFVGVSKKDDAEGDGGASLEKAIDRAAQLASEHGYAGTTFHLSVEIVPDEHNQWVRAYRAIITPHD